MAPKRRRIEACDGSHGGGAVHQEVYDPATTVIEVPNKALKQVPSGRGYRFLGRPGDEVYQLPQAVLGRHVHGEIDPHLWQDVGNGPQCRNCWQYKAEPHSPGCWIAAALRSGAPAQEEPKA